MSLDVYVMPLWRFKAGHLSTGTSRILGERSAISALSRIFRWGDSKIGATESGAKAEVRALCAQINKDTGTQPEWPDEGSTLFAEQASYGFEALRAFAKWLDLRDTYPIFEDPPDGNFYMHPVFQHHADPANLRFGHLVEHCCYNGYFLPCAMDRVYQVEPYEAWGRSFTRSVGSSLKLADQLSRLGQELVMPYSPLQTVSAHSSAMVRAGFDTLYQVAALSVQHRLPVILWS